MLKAIVFGFLCGIAMGAGPSPSPQESYNLVRQAVSTVRLNEAEHELMAKALSVLKSLVEEKSKTPKKESK